MSPWTFVLPGTLASGLMAATYLAMFGSWTIETGKVEHPSQSARNLLALSCFSSDHSSLPLLVFLFLDTISEAEDPGLGGVIRESAAVRLLEEEAPACVESTTF